MPLFLHSLRLVFLNYTYDCSGCVIVMTFWRFTSNWISAKLISKTSMETTSLFIMHFILLDSLLIKQVSIPIKIQSVSAFVI